MSPECNTQPDDHLMRILADKIEKSTKVMSVGFDRVEGFGELIKFGERALPVLFESIEEPAWWRMQAIWTIAHDLDKTIEFPEDVRGKYNPVRQIIVDWGIENGYMQPYE